MTQPKLTITCPLCEWVQEFTGDQPEYTPYVVWEQHYTTEHKEIPLNEKTTG